MATKSLGATADDLYRKREKIRVLEKQIKEMKSKLANEEETFIKRMNKSEVASVKGRIANATISESQVPTVKDWDQVYRYIKRYGAFDLMQRRLSTTAYRDRIEAGKKVPGVQTFTIYKPHITKRRV